jgi:predicted NBD/HSP70 family sugar kinase
MGSEEKIVIGAVDIGGTKIAVGMVDDAGRVLSKLESPTDAQRGYSRGLERMIGMLRETARVAGRHRIHWFGVPHQVGSDRVSPSGNDDHDFYTRTNA